MQGEEEYNGSDSIKPNYAHAFYLFNKAAEMGCPMAEYKFSLYPHRRYVFEDEKGLDCLDLDMAGVGCRSPTELLPLRGCLRNMFIIFRGVNYIPSTTNCLKYVPRSSKFLNWL
jgi:hypothetical protein